MKVRFVVLGFGYLLLLGIAFSLRPGTGSWVHEGQRRYLYLCSRRDHHDL